MFRRYITHVRRGSSQTVCAIEEPHVTIRVLCIQNYADSRITVAAAESAHQADTLTNKISAEAAGFC